MTGWLWLRRMLGMPPKEGQHPMPPITAPALAPIPPPSPALAAAQRRHRQLLTRADRAIQDAMAHADEAFGASTYGSPPRPDRRHAPR